MGGQDDQSLGLMVSRKGSVSCALSEGHGYGVYKPQEVCFSWHTCGVQLSGVGSLGLSGLVAGVFTR